MHAMNNFTFTHRSFLVDLPNHTTMISRQVSTEDDWLGVLTKPHERTSSRLSCVLLRERCEFAETGLHETEELHLQMSHSNNQRFRSHCPDILALPSNSETIDEYLLLLRQLTEDTQPSSFCSSVISSPNLSANRMMYTFIVALLLRESTSV